MTRFAEYFIATILGSLIGIAFLFPFSLLSSLLGILVVAILGAIATEYPPRYPKLSILFFGFSIHLVGFYWLPETLKLFGDFPDILAILLFSLFCLVHSMELFLIYYLFKLLNNKVFSKLPGSLFFLSFPLCWFLVELIFPKLFPWSLVHTQLYWSWFVSLAYLTGYKMLNFVFLLLGSLFFTIISRKSLAHSLLFILLFSATLSFGFYRENKLTQLISKSETLKIALVQAGATLEPSDTAIKETLNNYRKHTKILLESIQSDTIQSNTIKYEAEQDKVKNPSPPDLVIWPESASLFWTPIPPSFNNEQDKASRIPLPESVKPLLNPFKNGQGYQGQLIYGTLGLSRENTQNPVQTNTSIFIDKGELQGVYHKQVLMPFGEYLPLEKYFPWIRNLSPLSGDLSPGSPLQKPFSVLYRDKSGASKIAKIGVLICYEDLIPKNTLDYLSVGANILLNLTNDAWYIPIAREQHLLLSSFRAIESGKYLVRATSNGATAIISPQGKIIKRLDNDIEATLVTDIPIL